MISAIKSINLDYLDSFSNHLEAFNNFFCQIEYLKQNAQVSFVHILDITSRTNIIYLHPSFSKTPALDCNVSTYRSKLISFLDEIEEPELSGEFLILAITRKYPNVNLIKFLGEKITDRKYFSAALLTAINNIQYCVYEIIEYLEGQINDVQDLAKIFEFVDEWACDKKIGYSDSDLLRFTIFFCDKIKNLEDFDSFEKTVSVKKFTLELILYSDYRHGKQNWTRIQRVRKETKPNYIFFF